MSAIGRTVVLPGTTRPATPTERQGSTMPQQDSPIQRMIRGAAPELAGQHIEPHALETALANLAAESEAKLRDCLRTLEFLANRPTTTPEDRATVRRIKAVI